MKIDEGSILIENKITELEKKVKKTKNIEKLKYVFKEIVPEMLILTPAIVAHLELYKSNLSTDNKIVLGTLICIYDFIAALSIFLTHDNFEFFSKDEIILENLKKIQFYLKNNYNILKDINENTVDNFVYNFNEKDLLSDEIKLSLKKL